MTPPPRGIPVRAELFAAAGQTGARLLAAAMVFALAACSSNAPPPRNALQQSAASTGQSAARALGRGDLSQARQLYERALASADAVEDFALAGALLNNLALVHQRTAERESGASRLKELGTAQTYLTRILGAPHRYGPALQAAAGTRLAMVQMDGGQWEAASASVEQAAAACAAPCEQAAALSLLRAQLAWQRQDAAAAARHAELALASATAAGQASEQANALRQLGRSRARLGQTAQAAADLAQALAIDQRLGLPERVALDLLFAGDVEHARGQASAAREFYERSLVVSQAAGLAPLSARLRERLGR